MATEPGLRERKKQRTRELIADTARRLFAQRGFDAVPVSEIARAAEVSEATVFNYFPTKEDLVYHRLDAFENELLASIRDRAGGESVLAAFGRFVTVLRYTAAWVAGIGRMPWPKFLFWNAAGGICWATAVGLVAYYAGHAAADAIQRYGLYAAGGIAAAVLIAFLATHYGKRWLENRL